MTTQCDSEVSGTVGAACGLELRSGSVDETRRLGTRLGELLMPGDLVLLEGDLGAGKTALTQGIGAGLGVERTINSPTFTLLKEYMGRVPLYHFDLYRVENPDEVTALGFDDYFVGDGVCVVEWAERGEHGRHGAGERDSAESAWPASWLRIQFRKLSSDERLLCCSAAGERGAELLAALAQATEGHTA